MIYLSEEIKKNEEITPMDNDINTEPMEENQLSVENLQQQLAEKTALAEDYYNRMLRCQADFDNFRRRTRQEREDLLKYASEKLIIELLPVLDNFERALAAADNQGQDFASGVQMIHRQMQDVLAKEGLQVIAAVGEEFDPNRHEAVMQVESNDLVENTVAEEMLKGYMLQGKVIRPAMVKVAK